MFEPISVTYDDHFGSDLVVVNAARVSMDKASNWEFESVAQFIDAEVAEAIARIESKTGINIGAVLPVDRKLSERDARLIDYLARNSHWTPFAQVSVRVRIRAPIAIARQWFKHQIGFNRNEVSRRYVDTPPTFYLPDTLRTRPEGSIKQGSGGEHPVSDTWREAMAQAMRVSSETYQLMVADGIAPEQARLVLAQGMITEWVETASLAAVCRACKQRLDSHAQLEVREIAEQLAEIVAPRFPVSWSALMGAANG